MLSAQRLIGLPVIDEKTGHRTGKVLDLWFDEHWSLRGFLLKARRWWFKRYYDAALWESVTACGSDAILISDKSAVKRLEAAEIGRTFHTGQIRLKDLPVITDEGRQLGRVSDVYFQGFQGTPITGFELTDGFVSDLIEGRKRLKIPADPELLKLGENAILVPARCEHDLEAFVTESG
ncbi:Putative uncharacterized protein [Thermobacillus xylanilyticus]|uniref:PRC-barrel domain-containing protein n=1 Tax=Thermobacillus xylanilyticus TaxID=76633 RepID=A0ABN7S4V7_THEXY|nr:PRC-barrel domain-containing protein [Thermobacillus xylanilyticus]CAG5092159.1 Putative uncharacterized protein [Thermobacillus xylanilyticus]